MSNEEAFEQLVVLINQLGWSMALPMSDDDPEAIVPGLVIGTEDYIHKVLSGGFKDQIEGGK